MAGIAFLAVVREGLETALLFYAAVQGATSTATPLVAISAGIATAVLIGVAAVRQRGPGQPAASSSP